ncbi:uncharacterized protein LOC118512396 isoform X2 [Anopheles stephensi]|uniref:uncharacterized protein LOC118512396 isoform X2 n=1 Tax=Anopheles stephensi TaxID=30069 RepID=UPI00165892F9|nr:uncharacterized protein LOC118512396 isoform X2 [Anopheles stephensi]
MQWVRLQLVWIPIYLLLLLLSIVQPITGQFKIVNLNDGNRAFPSNGTTGSVTLVQIKPILTTANSSMSTELLHTKLANESGRALEHGMMVENKFIKLSIVGNSTSTGNKTRERKSQQTVRTDGRQNELLLYGDRSKTDRPLTNGDKTVVGYAKRSKIRSTSRADQGVNAQTSAESLASKVRRHKYRNFKSRCRCERIWNCARIQISVARCAPDYFMCCF